MAAVVNLKTAGPAKLSDYSRRVYRLGLYAYGHEFYEIARKARRSPVKSYLLGHALGLYLKSFLMKQGCGIQELKKRKYGHNISNLLSESVKRDFESHFRISPQLQTDIDAFSSSYAAKDFEYFPFFVWMLGRSLPETKRLFAFARRLDDRLPGIIG